MAVTHHIRSHLPMFTIILIALAAIVVVLLIVVAMQPSEFRVVRGIVISASPPAVFAHINDLHKWEAWSPWAKLDPMMKQTYEGAPAGLGAVSAWSGNSQVGEGRMTITESRPSKLIRMKLEFFKPFAATNTAEFRVTPDGQQTVVTWSMSGTNHFLSKAVHLVVNMGKMVGGQFEKGLANMKSVVEAVPES